MEINSYYAAHVNHYIPKYKHTSDFVSPVTVWQTYNYTSDVCFSHNSVADI